MRLTTLFIIVSVFLFAGFFYHPKEQNKFSKENKVENEDGMLKAWHHEFLMTKDPQLNRVPTERLIAAKKKMDDMTIASGRTTGADNTQTLSWQERGPNNIGGRTRALLIDQSDATGNTVFAAGVGGGLWKTTNFKTTCTWSVINDFFSNIAITCIKQSPTNNLIMYFGTGEGWGNIDAIEGLGIWKSTDGGSTWTQLSSTTNISYVNDLEFDNNGYIYATTRSTVSGMRGVLRSTDGGANWTQVLTDPDVNVTTRGADLERGPNGDMYASLGIFTLGHVFRSAANGTSTGISGSWTEITPPGITSNAFQRTEIGVCPNNSSRIYAMAQDDATDGIGAMYRSDDNGANWTTLTNASWCDQGATTNSDFSRTQAWYDLIMAVDPNSSSTVFAGGVVIVKTANSGTSWTQATRWTSSASCTSAPVIHADIHEILFYPSSSSEMIIGTDGGIYYSTDGGASFVDKNTGYRVTQYYGVAIHPNSGSNYMLAGAQDNGSHKFSSAGLNTVTTATGGDGCFCFINQTNSNYQITSFTDAQYSRSTNGGTSFSTVISSTNGRFINPADLDHKNNILYFGYTDGQYGHYDVTAGGTADIINLQTSPSSLTLTNLQLSAVKVDSNQSNVIWCGFSTSESSATDVVPVLVKVIRSNGPASGSPSTKPLGAIFSLPVSITAGAYISSIDIEPGNSNHLLITLSNYGVASVWESTDGGTNWNSLDNNGVNLPDMPVRWGMFIPSGNTARTNSVGGILLATELGVWSTTSINGTSTVWVANNSGLANVRSDQLVLRSSDKTVAVATHGRGVFTTTLVSAPLPVALLNFSGQLTNNVINLNWSTSSEQNSKYFEVQKSLDGFNFYSIGKVAAAGNSSSQRDYSLIDRNVAELNYYRLATVDVDGHTTMSRIILIKNIGGKQNLWIVNNPFESSIKIRFAKQPSQKIKVSLTTSIGEKVYYNEYAGNSELNIDLTSKQLSKGVYFLIAQVDGERFTKKLIKK